MSSGACRALVAVLLAIGATLGSTLPMAAEAERLVEQSTAIYKVDPAKGSIDVIVVVKLTNNAPQAYNLGTWGPLVMEELVVPRVSKGFAVGDSRDLPGLWRAVDVSTPVIDGDGGSVNLQVAYTLDAAIDQNESRASQTPARVGEGYIYFCMVGQDTDVGLVRVEIAGKDRFKLTQSGTVMEPTPKGLKSARSVEPAEHFTCVEGTVDANLATSTFVGPAEREIVLQAWPEADNWLDAAEANAEPTLDAIHAFLGRDIPGEGPVIVRQAPPRSLGGYASAHDTPGVVQLDESAGIDGAEHELAHAWFGTDNFTELWLREGMAEWTATTMAGTTCPAAASGPSALDLSDWQVLRPTADAETIDTVMADQQAAACGIVSAMTERMSEEQWRTVVGSLLDGETKYVGRDEPTPRPARAWTSASGWTPSTSAVSCRRGRPTLPSPPTWTTSTSPRTCSRTTASPPTRRSWRSAPRPAPATTSSWSMPHRSVPRYRSERPWTTGSSTTP